MISLGPIIALVRKKELTTMIKHNRNTIYALIIAIILSIYLLGCQPKTSSLINPEEQVIRSVLEMEFEQLSKRIDVDHEQLEREMLKRLNELERKEEINKAINAAGKAFTSTGEINPVGIVAILAAVFGVGAVADNRKKDGIIKTLKSTPNANSTE